ncbi:MAG: ParB/RepB/Spo0J family partition protein [Microscillaceae bacterium]|nr:ParB/RepB/Spo0J family partition protein [Microscillaceae bacterium]
MNFTQIYDIPLKDIELKGINVRTDLTTEHSKEALKELAENIQVNGLMQPIVLRGEFGKPPYDVVVGQRRFLAHRDILKTSTIKATFTGIIEDLEAKILSLSENLLRQELNQADIMEVVTELYNRFDKDEHKVKEKLGLSMKAIRGYIKVESQASEKIKNLIREGKVSLIDAKRAIDAAQGDLNKADRLIDELPKMTKYEKIRAVEYGKSNPVISVEKLIEKAQTPKVEESVILNLPLKVAKALIQASEDLQTDSEVLIMNALTSWLITNDYLKS